MHALLRRSVLLGVIGTGLTMVAAHSAWALEPAKGKVILTISGKIGETNAPTGALFDLSMLEKLPQQTFSTNTPWDKAPVKFKGPLLRDVLAAVKANGTTLKAMALNDYQTTIPVEDATRFNVIVAHQMNDKAIPISTKGPLFIIYPYDSLEELRAAKYYERSAWQLKSLTVE
ncbi:molybdopterin-dependent oxidoreductase [Curvibacter sp. CHRR-16]|uniref:molybdopterin-dependent oxidoreductase n=1 Tax=Curvibacter sp. CHRR-16 TaxID=2835872 RepID=UPI001BD91984|nr:molybdopterin-dependent oxidoreductase [Curvibacter sp. CHRR-16]MBT0571428.1 molybdopterin-dependent oxidoreductase [Curvibacter sp. CHRR-16]